MKKGMAQLVICILLCFGSLSMTAQTGVKVGDLPKLVMNDTGMYIVVTKDVGGTKTTYVYKGTNFLFKKDSTYYTTIAAFNAALGQKVSVADSGVKYVTPAGVAGFRTDTTGLSARIDQKVNATDSGVKYTTPKTIKDSANAQTLANVTRKGATTPYDTRFVNATDASYYVGTQSGTGLYGYAGGMAQWALYNAGSTGRLTLYTFAGGSNRSLDIIPSISANATITITKSGQVAMTSDLPDTTKRVLYSDSTVKYVTPAQLNTGEALNVKLTDSTTKWVTRAQFNTSLALKLNAIDSNIYRTVAAANTAQALNLKGGDTTAKTIPTSTGANAFYNYQTINVPVTGGTNPISALIIGGTTNTLTNVSPGKFMMIGNNLITPGNTPVPDSLEMLLKTGSSASPTSTVTFNHSGAAFISHVSTTTTIANNLSVGTSVTAGNGLIGQTMTLSSNATISGSMRLNTTKTTVSGSTSGNVEFVQTYQGNSQKEVLIHCNALVGTASFTFPTPFTYTPDAQQTDGLATSVITTKTTTTVTVTGTTTTGGLLLKGW